MFDIWIIRSIVCGRWKTYSFHLRYPSKYIKRSKEILAILLKCYVKHDMIFKSNIRGEINDK